MQWLWELFICEHSSGLRIAMIEHELWHVNEKLSFIDSEDVFYLEEYQYFKISSK